MITVPEVEAYLHQLVPERSALLQELERHAEQEGIPIMQLPALQFLSTLVAIKQPKRILEVGTAIGYSAIWLAKAAPYARITTMELDNGRVSRAMENFEKANLRDRVEVIAGDAREGLPEHYKFDFIFIDAAKGQYANFFDLYFPHLEEHGLLVCDNVLFRGMVADNEAGNKADNKRLKPMIRKLQEFNRFLMEHPLLQTSIVPVGDGVAVCVRKPRADQPDSWPETNGDQPDS